MILSEKTFYRILLLGLLLCGALYAEETIHFLRYGWKDPDTDARISDISKCKPVPGSSTDLECPIRGYGLALYRYKEDKEPGHDKPNEIFLVY